jgi:hypothetical protein
MRKVTTKENTYGFEIEFCTHDNTLLRYTHIEVAQIKLKGDAFEFGNQLPLKIETDSGDVLELVTPPIIFSTIENAKTFRGYLAEYLKTSVAQALTFKEWMDKYSNELIDNMNTWYLDIEGKKSPQIEKAGEWELIPFNDINLNVSVNNIDDGINIAAANYRKSQIKSQEEWNIYLAQTVLCASTKDWPTGYSTQMSLPMTVIDYVKYVISNKLLKSTANIIRLIALREDPELEADNLDATLEWEKVEKWLTTWFWGGVIFDMFLVYQNHVLGSGTQNASDLNQVALDSKVERNLKLKWSKKLGKCDYVIPNISITLEEALLFIIVQKTLTGALGALSEGLQLTKQNKAAEVLNAAKMEDKSKVWSQGGKYYWCEYHSSLKDLLGVWFKGHLADVLLHLCRDRDREQRLKLGGALNEVQTQLKDIYKKRLELANNIVDKLEKISPEFVYMKDDKQLGNLIKAHDQVIQKTATFLIQDNDTWEGAQRKQEFLDYSSGDTFWEGRKDTLISRIEHLNENTRQMEIFFLVEHRNN